MPDKRTQHKEVLFSGKLWTTEPAVIGQNFRTLKNMRYTDTHIKGIQGMAKINVTALTTYPRVRNAFHFSKSQPAESHIIVQAYTTAETVSALLEHTAVIPATGAFSIAALIIDTTAAGRGRFSDAPDGQIIYANGIDTCIWGGEEMNVGAFITVEAEVTANCVLTNAKDYTDVVNNTKTDSVNLIVITTAANTWLIGSPRPLWGVKYYIQNANGTASVMTGTYWDGTQWAANALTDNTDTGASLAITGTVTFGSTVLTAKPIYINGYYLYWYQFNLSAGAANLYHVTLDAPMQNIPDMWDGIFRDVTRFYKYTTSYLDNTINVLYDDYDSASASTYSDLSSMGAFSDPNNCLQIGFGEKQTGLTISVAPEYTNSTAATVMSVDYWNGTAWTTVGTITDGTSEGGISLAKTGVVTWNNTYLTGETKKVVSNSLPLYYYRVKFDKAMDASVRVNYVGGISAQKQISHYKFPVFAQGRILLCCDMAGQKNKAACSSKYMPQVYNGVDSVDIYFGEEGELTAGVELFSQFGSSLYSLVLMFKDTETWVMAGQDITQWENNIFLLSNTIGCPAPLTLKTINLHAEPGAGINRALAIWQGANGIYMSDGRAPIPIHGDIKEYFDRQGSRCIKASMIGDSVGWIDPVNQEYHWLFASGSAATTLNTELVYDIARNKWFEIERSADLQCGVLVHDTDGNAYCYGFLDTGYMLRLEYGTTDNTADITHTVQFGDLPLAGLAVETRLSHVRLLTVAKTTTANSITLTHYGDTNTTGTDKTMSPAKTGYRVAMPYFDDKFKGDPFHSFRLVMVTNDETVGFEPLALVATFHATHEDV